MCLICFIILLRQLRTGVLENFSGIDSHRNDFQLCERAIRSRVTLRKAGRVEPSGGKRLNNLARRGAGLSRDGVNTFFTAFTKPFRRLAQAPLQL
jgi:hypothetical protein